jgi:hypothetical protein
LAQTRAKYKKRRKLCNEQNHRKKIKVLQMLREEETVKEIEPDQINEREMAFFPNEDFLGKVVAFYFFLFLDIMLQSLKLSVTDTHPPVYPALQQIFMTPITAVIKRIARFFENCCLCEKNLTLKI